MSPLSNQPLTSSMHAGESPSMDIVAAADAARRAEAEAGRPRLDRVFVMTNGAPEWVALLKQALAATGHYKHVASSRDLVLSWEQKYVAQAVDMVGPLSSEVDVLMTAKSLLQQQTPILAPMAPDPTRPHSAGATPPYDMPGATLPGPVPVVPVSLAAPIPPPGGVFFPTPS